MMISSIWENKSHVPVTTNQIKTYTNILGTSLSTMIHHGSPAAPAAVLHRSNGRSTGNARRNGRHLWSMKQWGFPTIGPWRYFKGILMDPG